MSAKSEKTLLGLPLVIFRMILEFLHEDDSHALYALKSVSRICRNESDTFIFRTIRLQDHVFRHKSDILDEEQYGDINRWHLIDSELRKRTIGMVQSILAENNPVAGNVQHLQIGSFRQDFFDSDIAPVLGRVLVSLTNLQSLSWETNIAIPEFALDAFHTTHPTARLHVIHRIRQKNPLDQLLLSSPQLYSLHMNVYFESIGVCPVEEGPSELQMLKRCLMQGNSIRVLHLGLEDIWEEPDGKPISCLDMKNWEHGPLNFHWQEGDRFPALQEWGWGKVTQYVYSKHQLEMWRQSMDWTQLRVLDFGFCFLTTMQPFKSLAGQVPRLNSLSVAIVANQYPNMQDSERVVPVFENFLRSTTALEKLDLRWKFIPECLPIILHHRGHALRWLVLRYLGSTDSWDRDQCIDVLSKAPKLSHLRVQTFPSSARRMVDFQGTWSGHAITSSPSEKYLAMEDAEIEASARMERAYAAKWEQMRTRREKLQTARERTPQEIARVLQLAEENPRGQ